MSLKTKLQSGAHALGLALSDTQVSTLLAYISLLHKWNQHYNLSAIREPSLMITHHLLDSLSVTPYVSECDRILDVGTGAGLPGLVLAIFFPTHHFSLMDSCGKKIRFLVQAKHELKIENINIIQSRSENYQTTDCFDGIISRALGPINELIHNTKPLLCESGCWFAMKGVYPFEELETLSLPFRVEELNVPTLNSRHVVIIKKASHTHENNCDR